MGEEGVGCGADAESGKRWVMCPGWPRGPEEEDKVRAEDKSRRGRITRSPERDWGLFLGDLTPDEDQEEEADVGGGDAPKGAL